MGTWGAVVQNILAKKKNDKNKRAFCNDNWLGALHEEIKEIPQIDIILSNKMESSLH